MGRLDLVPEYVERHLLAVSRGLDIDDDRFVGEPMEGLDVVAGTIAVDYRHASDHCP